MKKNYKILIFFLCILCGKLFPSKRYKQPPLEQLEKKYDFYCTEKKIVVIIPSYNNEKYYKENLDSVINQDYENFYIIYRNDCSKDNTGQLVSQYIKENKLEKKIILINNKKRIGSLANIYESIYSCPNDTIIILLDGDDRLAHNKVLKVINSIYQNSDIWLTYGQYAVIPGYTIPWCSHYSDKDIANNNFRKDSMLISHPKTFYAGLFKLIKLEDLLYNGDFYPTTGDKAFMLPMIEMASYRYKRITDILYLYNNANAINVHKVTPWLQLKLKSEIRKKKPYKPVTWEDIINAK